VLAILADQLKRVVNLTFNEILLVNGLFVVKGDGESVNSQIIEVENEINIACPKLCYCLYEGCIVKNPGI
jgi:uncharacterized protein YlzI (FlbEa/FlbD family)